MAQRVRQGYAAACRPPRTRSSAVQRRRSRWAATPPPTRWPAWSATWPPTPPPRSPRRRSTSAAGSATSEVASPARYAGQAIPEKEDNMTQNGRTKSSTRSGFWRLGRRGLPADRRCCELAADLPADGPRRARRAGQAQERIRIWATANGEAKTWTSRRVLDPRQLRDRVPPGGHHRRRWPRWAGPGSSSRRRGGVAGAAAARLPGRVDDDPDDLAWIDQAVDRNSRSELAALKANVELAATRPRTCVLTFEDTVHDQRPGRGRLRLHQRGRALWRSGCRTSPGSC